MLAVFRAPLLAFMLALASVARTQTESPTGADAGSTRRRGFDLGIAALYDVSSRPAHASRWAAIAVTGWFPTLVPHTRGRVDIPFANWDRTWVTATAEVAPGRGRFRPFAVGGLAGGWRTEDAALLTYTVGAGVRWPGRPVGAQLEVRRVGRILDWASLGIVIPLR